MTRAEAMNQNAKRGRPPGAVNKIPQEFKKTCLQYTPEVVDLWVTVLTDPNADLKYRLIAAERLAEYGNGRPTQAITAEVNQSGRLIIEFVNDWRKRGDDSGDSKE